MDKKAQFMPLDIIMYFIILVFLVLTFIFIATFTPGEYKPIDVDQKGLGLYRELQSTLDLRIEGKSLTQLVFSDELQTNEKTFAQVDALFTELNLCGAFLTEPMKTNTFFGERFVEEKTLGRETCAYMLSEIYIRHQDLVTEKVVISLGDEQILILFEDVQRNALMLFANEKQLYEIEYQVGRRQ